MSRPDCYICWDTGYTEMTTEDGEKVQSNEFCDCEAGIVVECEVKYNLPEEWENYKDWLEQGGMTETQIRHFLSVDEMGFYRWMLEHGISEKEKKNAKILYHPTFSRKSDSAESSSDQ